MSYKSLPKIELHIHLDCSLSYNVVKKLRPEITIQEYNQNFKAGASCSSLNHYIQCADNAISLMQTKESLELVLEDFFDQLVEDNVIYCEIRFAPLLHIEKSLNSMEVVDILCKKMNQLSKKTEIITGLILCTLRHYSKSQSMETVKLVNEFYDKGVVGFDIAADEAGFPIDNHISAFEYAQHNKLNCTAHAGEAMGAESVWETINKLKPKRIGHGVRSIEDEKLIDFILENNFHLEVCPTSNIKTKTFESMDKHPIDKLFKKNISLSINSDGRTISDVNLNEEYHKLSNSFGWSVQQLQQCNLNAIDHAFTTDNNKELLRQKINLAYHK